MPKYQKGYSSKHHGKPKILLPSSTPHQTKHQAAYQIILGQDVIHAIKINVDVADSVFC